MKSKVISVGKDLIADAVQRDSGHCMIAEAVRAGVEGAQRISVDLQTIRFTVGDDRYVFLTPRRAQLALVNFDQGKKPDPFHIRLTGGQVTPAHADWKKRDPKWRKKRNRKLRKISRAKKHGTLKIDSNSPRDVPMIVGGRTPPLVPGGNRRSFGLRALER